MVHVVLDTSIFSGDRRRQSGPFRALVRLCEAKKIQLHVPYYVKNEFVTQQEEKIRGWLKQIRESAGEVLAVTGQKGILEYIESVRKENKSLRDDALNILTKEFAGWLTGARAIEYPVGESDGVRLSEDYFKGTLPFRSQKNRDDFPDAFVWQTILQILKKEKVLHVVASDGRLCSAAHNRSVPHRTDALVWPP